MFLVRYLKYGFSFKTLLSRHNENLFKVIIYLFIISLIITFPLNYLSVISQGTKLDFIHQDFQTNVPLDLKFPVDSRIQNDQLIFPEGETLTFKHKEITYVLNTNQNDFINYPNHIFLEKTYVVYVGENKTYLKVDRYEGFNDENFSLETYNTLSNEDKEIFFDEFSKKLENSFARYTTLYTVIRNTVITIFTNFLFAFLMALLLQVFRFGYSRFFSVIDSFKFVVISMGIPAIASFIVGVLVPGFGPVVLQFGIGLIVMITMIKYGKKYFS